MEMLLRRHARRNASPMAEATSGAAPTRQAVHMDADELSAYAEGALPERARNRYSMHLADCDMCRRVLTDLVTSAGIAPGDVEGAAHTVNAPVRSWRGWLAALFAPRVMRFAAPALALCAFVAIVLVVATRNRDTVPFIAQNEPNRQQAVNPSATERRDEKENSAAGANTSPDNQGAPSTATANNTAREAGAPTAPPAVSQPPQTDGTTATAPPADRVSPSAAPKSADTSAGKPQPSSVNEGTAQPAPPPTPTFSNSPVEKRADASKEKDDSLSAAKQRTESAAGTAGGGAPGGPVNARRSRKTETAETGSLGRSTAAANEERQQEQAKSAPATGARAQRDAAGEDENKSETRTVAGKRFRQRNGIWVDTAYNSSRSPLRVKRGSEQYRALVADEPVIGSVANALGGSVIVVIKGRAYHIY
jgi:hypothetical protein